MSTPGFQQFWNSTILLIFSESRNQFACHSQLLGQRVVWWQSPTTTTTRTSRAGAGRGRSGILWEDSEQSPPRSGRNISVRMWLRMPLLYFNGMIFGHVRAHMLHIYLSLIPSPVSVYGTEGIKRETLQLRQSERSQWVGIFRSDRISSFYIVGN